MRRGKKVLAGFLGIVVLFVTLMSGVPMKAEAANDTLLNTYGKTYGRVGTCINSWQLTNANTLSHVKSQYNSITLENEMKPDALLGWSASLITVSQAKSLGYYIPNNYKEAYVPKINFGTIDNVLKICYQNGIGVRAHTLVWHSQTPSWFFRNGYSGNGGYVSQATMDARLEMYVKTVMNHVYTSQYGSVVYAWDVANEILHANNSGWEAIYGNNRTNASYVKKAFQYANDTLKYFKLTDKVSLFYNDFNTYMEVNDVIKLVNYINSNGKICNGVGMQSHLGTTFPSVDYYTSALNAFLKAGFEVQITELDVASSSPEDQARYIYNLFKNINTAKKNGGKITGITFWGLSDDVSWIEGNKYPLLFSKLGVAKQSYYKVLQAYSEAGFASNNNNNNNNTQTSTTDNRPYAKIADGWYCIKNVNSQTYLSTDGNDRGSNVILQRGNGATNQKWYLTNNADGTITLKNGNGLALDVTEGKADNVTNIELWSFTAKDPQKFMLKDAGNGQYGILTRSTNGSGCLDPANAGKTDGTNIQQYTYYATTAQKWVFEKTNDPNAPVVNNTPTTDIKPYANIADGWYYIKNINAQNYLTSNGAESGSNVILSTGNGAKEQKWYLTNNADGTITLKNGSGMMLDVTGGKADNVTNIELWTGNGKDSQKFMLKDAGNGQYGILTKSTNGSGCLDPANADKAAGTNIQQYTYYATTSQKWIFEETTDPNAPVANITGVSIADGWYYIKNVNAQKYLQVAGNSGNAMQNVEIGTGTGVAGQKWYVTNTSDGYITLTSGLGNFMLDVEKGENKDGTNLIIYNAYSGDPQKFALLPTSTNGVYTIGTKVSNLEKMVEVYNHSKLEGANVGQWTLFGNPNQQWIFEPIK